MLQMRMTRAWSCEGCRAPGNCFHSVLHLAMQARANRNTPTQHDLRQSHTISRQHNMILHRFDMGVGEADLAETENRRSGTAAR